ncbi:MAG TPA: FAD-dependent oxidoreductase, partial [Thermoanaerobaculia bacterium]
MPRYDTDILIIGAGAAGLAAARELSGAGRRAIVLEARGRIGGRIHTLHLPDSPVPIELGAEFVHGEVDTTFSIIEAAALTAIELPDTHHWSRNGKWETIGDFWERIDKVRRQIGNLARDVSFDEFLRSKRSLSPRLRELSRTFVEGYHAAHADRISALALKSADSEQEQDDPSGNKQFRIANGYDALIAWLRAGLDPGRVELRLGTVVSEIRWGANDVTLVCRSNGREETLRARAALITVPIGVLKAPRDQEGAIRFDPPLREKE